MKQDGKLHALKINRIRCILAIIVCPVLSALVLIALTEQIASDPTPLVEEVGWKSYHMFTILSNLFMGTVAAMCIPFAVDGLRYHNYHLPRWYVTLMYMGTLGVALTFLIALTVLSPGVSFYRIMIFSNNIFFHTICPILAIILFLFINSDHKIGFKASIIATLPVMAYSAIYIILVFVVGEDKGGWRDHYQISRAMEFIPLPVVVILLLIVCLVLSNALRIGHNIIHARRKDSVEEYYQTADVFAQPDIQSAIRTLARIQRTRDLGGELIVPRRIMGMMDKKYQSGLSLEEMCAEYINEYFSEEKEESPESEL